MDIDFIRLVTQWSPYHTVGVLLLVFGIVLILVTVMRKVKGVPKKLQLLAGASAMGFPVFGLLLRVTYDMGELAVIFFVLFLIVCPLGLLVGVIGSIIYRIKL